MRRIFSDWMENEQAWIVAPFVLWLIAYVAYVAFRMLRDRRVYGPYSFASQLGPVWKWSFVAALIWLIGGAVVTSLGEGS